MLDSQIKSLKDLNNLRSAPNLDQNQAELLLVELSRYMDDADWFTVGIMASSSKSAIFVLKEMENLFKWTEMKIINKPTGDGPVFLKANQKTGDAHLRIEHGLGEGILLSCQQNDVQKNSETFGPFPLNFFKSKD